MTSFSVKVRQLCSSPSCSIHLLFSQSDFSSSCPRSGPLRPIDSECLVESLNRINRLQKRCSCYGISTRRPIFYKSRLFEPISGLSPTILVDLVIPQHANHRSDLEQRNLHVTLYDITHRFDYDERGWIEKVKNMFGALSGSHSRSPKESDTAKLTKCFLSVVDCNVDYTSSFRFETASRTIVRVGDLRFSSNIVSPLAPTQAFSLSLGDVSVYICNSRFPYHFENSRLVDSKALVELDEESSERLSTKSSDTVLLEMNYRTVLMLDSLDSVIAVSNVSTKQSSDPSLRINLTVGEVCLYFCKDSFARLMSTIGELSKEMTALDEEAFEALKNRATSRIGDSETFYDSLAEEAQEQQPQDSPHPKYYVLDDLKKKSALRPSLGTDAKNDRSKDFLLDGYDWTAIDMDENTAELGIPAGEEQAARWYLSGEKTETTEDVCEHVGFLAGSGTTDVIGPSRSPKRQGPQLIAHHFPLHPVADPLGDGDMGASKYAGAGSPPRVRVRVLVHDLAIKLRCFDGFDWPELLSEESRSLPRRGPFIIDEVANEKTNETKKAVTENISDKLDTRDDLKKLERRAQLMGDLLAGNAQMSSTFKAVPLPEDKGRSMKEQAELRRLARRTNRYFQFSASGVSLRLDNFEDSMEHSLASCIALKAQDFFVAETISNDRPVKMAGEWVNDREHPRDTRHGLFSMKVRMCLSCAKTRRVGI